MNVVFFFHHAFLIIQSSLILFMADMPQLKKG
jgi:hypothetical protein